MPRVLLLIGTESYRARDFLDAAHSLNVTAVVGTDDAPVLDSLTPDSTLELSFHDLEKGAEAIRGYHANHPLDAVVAVDDDGTALAARASALLGLPSNPEEAVVAASNKYVFREIQGASGLPTPAFRRVSLKENPADLAKSTVYPCVLKPLFLNSSRGVIRANTPKEFVTAFRRIGKLLDDPELQQKGGPEADSLLIEAYLPGLEVSLEGSVKDGQLRVLAILDKPEPMEGPYFEETLFVTPSRHSPTVQNELTRQGQEAIRLLGLRSGPVHAEFRIHRGAVTLLELAPRSIGGNCARILRFGTGQSLESIILRQALGIPEGDIYREKQAAGVMMIPIPCAGVLRDYGGLDAACAVDGIEGVEITIPKGQPVVPPPDGNRYLGFIYARGKSPEFVERALRAAHGRLNFDIAAE